MNPINRNDTAKRLRAAVNNLAPPLRASLTNVSKLKYLFFDWFLRLGRTEIIVNNTHIEVEPDDWSDPNAQSYTVEFKGKLLYLFVAEFRPNVVIIWLQDTLLRESFEARPVFVDRIPELKEQPTQTEINNEDELVSLITGEFYSFFQPFLLSIAAGKKPHRKSYGSSTCSSTNSR